MSAILRPRQTVWPNALPLVVCFVAGLFCHRANVVDLFYFNLTSEAIGPLMQLSVSMKLCSMDENTRQLTLPSFRCVIRLCLVVNS